ncbi:hypothetical protein UFOVP891_43 [uncultured Caudovirales phage]|uniref:Uncharacterized protein n=1 Tax=uncultured Caudovirales phage TaxID=2100421 RepID=A0A6J5RP28_9CAUD|nr:hypothetical protein UFOVP472_24 [uncultured Caudovirales phage]CAB4169161.1 hypothetical protein UFOVP891_43 [uncultured Caudovirales phage]CAB4180764.1 hypothetical protein UFOVP1053_24 [uncultured Caudovirales phage]CAB4195986.1 hypothetical protein UFOVP1297_49 [uncultured Caudovirales phage]CAB4221891.1 hypothetical protein UFOVP1647_27 [uncultured Caudovirales phage]
MSVEGQQENQEQQQTEQEAQDEAMWDRVQQDRTSTIADEGDQADPLAGLPEPTRKLIEGLTKTVQEQDGRLKEVGQKLATAHGTMGSMKQQLDVSRDLLQKLTPAAESINATRKAEEKAEQDAIAAEREAALEEVREVFPNFVKAFPNLLTDAKPVKQEVQEPEQAVNQGPVVDPQVVRLQLDLTDLSPGWRAKVATAEYQQWINANPDMKRIADHSLDVKESASVLTAFDKHRSSTQQVAQVEKERQERLRRAEGIRGRGGSTGNMDSSEDALWNKVTNDRAKARA